MKKLINNLIKKLKKHSIEIILIIIVTVLYFVIPSHLCNQKEVFLSIIITVFLGLWVDCFLDCIVSKPANPDETTNKILEPVLTGQWIGFFERLLMLISFLIQEYLIIAGWFAFKVAAKWEAWSTIVKVPDKMNGISELDWFLDRKRIGSYLLSRFLIGTLINVLISAIAVYIAQLITNL